MKETSRSSAVVREDGVRNTGRIIPSICAINIEKLE